MNFFIKIHRCMTDFGFYADEAEQPLKKSVVYLILISILLSSFLTISFVYSFSKAYWLVEEEFSRDIPDFTIRDGIFSTDAKLPYNTKISGLPIIIASDGNLPETAINSYNTAILVLKDKAIIKNLNKQETINFSNLKSIALTKADAARAMSVFKYIVYVAVLFLMPISFFIAKFFNALFLSIFGIISARMVGISLGYSKVLKLSIYALTLSMLIDTVLNVFLQSISSYWMIFYYGIATIYLSNAIIRIKRDKGTGPSSL